jgi:uncharacterized protein (TIGR02145 family)
MKKSIIIIFFAIIILRTQAQDYFISFTGTGDTNVVTSVKVDNLVTGATVTLNNSEILHLTGGLGVPALNANSGKLNLLPNPIIDHSRLTFVTAENGMAHLQILDLSGNILCQKNIFLTSGQHSFSISGIRKGIYVVKVTGNKYAYSTELISQIESLNEATIDYISTVQITSDNQVKDTKASVDMPYKDGDGLLYKSITGKYSTIISNIPTSSKTVTFNFSACTDADNNNYSVVKIGAQTWMAENLNVGTRIDGSSNQTNNNKIEKYCYKNDVQNCNLYGGLYNCDEMMQYAKIPGSQGICPQGWHVPTDEEWTELTTYLGGEVLAGEKLKETGTSHWWNTKSRVTNESGFSSLPAGTHQWITSHDNEYYDMGRIGYYWSSTESRFSNLIGRFTYFDSGNVWPINHSLYYDGLSVRCIKN